MEEGSTDNPDASANDESVVEDGKASREDDHLDIKDERYAFAMTPDRILVANEEGNELIENADAVLGETVMERQRELQQARTMAMLTKYKEREGNVMRKKMLYRFRALVRLMTLAYSLRNYGAMYYERMQGISKTTQVQSNVPNFDVNDYRRSKVAQVPPQVKRMLSKPPWLRTEEELSIIYKAVCDLKFFDKYPRKTLRDMAPVINYSYIPPNRVVLRQGHMPVNFYFILSGLLLVLIEENDLDGKPCTRQIGKLGPGCSFGELALIHNTPRTATVMTRYATEVLTIYKEDFDEVLRDAAEHAWRGIYNTLTQLPVFSAWRLDQLEHCSNNCKMVKYQHNKVIVGNIVGRPDNLYFIVDGKCRLVEIVHLIVTTASPKCAPSVTLVPLRSGGSSENYPAPKMKPWSRIVRRFLHIMTLKKGQCFGSGEDLIQRYVVAWGNVECLEIPHSYLTRNKHSNWMDILQDKIQANIPSHKFVFDDFVGRATWRTYKKDLLRELTESRTKITETTLEDVPLSIRLAEDVEDSNYSVLSH